MLISAIRSNGTATDGPLIVDVFTSTIINDKKNSLNYGFLFQNDNNSTTLLEANGCISYANFSYDIVILVLCILCLIVGLVYSFFGYRLFRIVLFLTGFLFGSVLIYLLCEKEQLLSTLYNVCVGVGAGILFGLITTLVQYVGLFMTGFLTGLLLGVIVMTVWSSVVPPDTLWVTIGILFCSGIIFALLTLKFQRIMIIASTSLVGGALIAISFNYFIEKFLTAQRFWDALNVRKTHWNDLCWFSWLIILIWPVMFFISNLVQWKLTSVGFTHKAGWPHFRRRRSIRNEQRISAHSNRDHPRRDNSAALGIPSAAHNPMPKSSETKSFRYLYQARRNQGDIICQSYIDSMQKLAQTRVSVKATPTLSSDQTQLTMLTNDSNRSDPNTNSV